MEGSISHSEKGGQLLAELFAGLLSCGYLESILQIKKLRPRREAGTPLVGAWLPTTRPRAHDCEVGVDPTALGDLRLRFSLRCSAPWSRESARHFKFKKERAGGQAGEREGARGGLLGACPDCGAALFCRRAPRSPRSVQRGSGARRVPETLQGWRSGWQSDSCASQRREAGTGAAEQRQRLESDPRPQRRNPG